MEILEKGVNVAVKDAQGADLTNVRVGLGWDTGSESIDIDASMLMLKGGRHNNGGKVLGNSGALLYYGCLDLPGLHHHGDNRTGAGDGDDEKLDVTFAALPTECTSIMVIANIFAGVSNFGSVNNVTCNVYDSITSTNKLATLDLTEDYSGKNAIIVGEFYKHNGSWKYAAIGEGITGQLKDVIHRWE